MSKIYKCDICNKENKKLNYIDYQEQYKIFVLNQI